VKALKQENSVCHSMVHLNRKMVGLLALRNPKISTNCKAPVYGGDSACPPEPAALCDCVVLPFPGVIAPGATAAGADVLHAVAPLKALRKMF